MESKMRKVAKEEVGKHVKAMHKGKGEGKGFKKGGKTDADMLKYGRGMAKVMNQKVAP